jgi:hypothetical protein
MFILSNMKKTGKTLLYLSLSSLFEVLIDGLSTPVEHVHQFWPLQKGRSLQHKRIQNILIVP